MHRKYNWKYIEEYANLLIDQFYSEENINAWKEIALAASDHDSLKLGYLLGKMNTFSSNDLYRYIRGEE